MTRICTLCKQIMGEKCARCGTEATPLKANSYGQAVTGTEFDCPSCGHHFPQGDGGETAPPANRGGFRFVRSRRLAGEFRTSRAGPETGRAGCDCPAPDSRAHPRWHDYLAWGRTGKEHRLVVIHSQREPTQNSHKEREDKHW